MFVLLNNVKESTFKIGLFYYISQLYFPFIREYTVKKRKIIAEEANKIDAKKVLDFGCAVGHMAPIFNPDSYLGLDINESYLKFAKKKYKGYEFKLIQNGIIDVPDNSIDLILCLGTLHHINDKESKNIIDHFHKKLRKGGRTIFIDSAPAYQQPNAFVKIIVASDIGENIRTLEQTRDLISKDFKIVNGEIRKIGKYNFVYFVLEK